MRGLGDAPRHAALLAVGLLNANRGSQRPIQQRARIRAQVKLRHQILEHRAAPGQQRHLIAIGGELASQPEPGLARDVAFGDRQENRGPGFGRQQIVAGLIAPDPSSTL